MTYLPQTFFCSNHHSLRLKAFSASVACLTHWSGSSDCLRMSKNTTWLSCSHTHASKSLNTFERIWYIKELSIMNASHWLLAYFMSSQSLIYWMFDILSTMVLWQPSLCQGSGKYHIPSKTCTIWRFCHTTWASGKPHTSLMNLSWSTVDSKLRNSDPLWAPLGHLHLFYVIPPLLDFENFSSLDKKCHKTWKNIPWSTSIFLAITSLNESLVNIIFINFLTVGGKGLLEG